MAAEAKGQVAELTSQRRGEKASPPRPRAERAAQRDQLDLLNDPR